jgi:hypothetical protein
MGIVQQNAALGKLPLECDAAESFFTDGNLRKGFKGESE